MLVAILGRFYSDPNGFFQPVNLGFTLNSYPYILNHLLESAIDSLMLDDTVSWRCNYFSEKRIVGTSGHRTRDIFKHRACDNAQHNSVLITFQGSDRSRRRSLSLEFSDAEEVLSDKSQSHQNHRSSVSSTSFVQLTKITQSVYYFNFLRFSREKMRNENCVVSHT